MYVPRYDDLPWRAIDTEARPGGADDDAKLPSASVPSSLYRRNANFNLRARETDLITAA